MTFRSTSKAAMLCISPAALIYPSHCEKAISAEAPCPDDLWKQRHLVEALQVRLDEEVADFEDRIGTGSRYQPAYVAVQGILEDYEGKRTATAEPKPASAIISEICATLSLQIKELAQIIGVERPTIYCWIKGTSEPKKENSRRLRDVYTVAVQWKKRSSKPVGSARNDAASDGSSLVDLLSQAPFPHQRIADHLDSLLAIASDTASPKTLRERAIERRISPQREAIDVLTGKRASMD